MQQKMSTAGLIKQNKDTSFKIIKSVNKEKRMKRSELQIPSRKTSYAFFSGVPAGEERKKGGEKKMFKEVMAVNFLNLGRDLDVQVHEAHKSPKRSSPRQIIIKVSERKDKERNLKPAKRKILHIRRNPHETISELLSRSLVCQERIR